MTRSSTFAGLTMAVIAAMSFGMSGPFVKPLLEAGWSPGAAVTVRAFVGAILLAPVAAVMLRGRWSVLWRARRRVLAMALVGVIGTQLTYFAAIERIPVGTAILVEYMAPILLVVAVWARSRRVPRGVVIIGSVFALLGLALVVSPSTEGGIDFLGLLFALAAMIAAAGYFVIAAHDDGVPPVAMAAAGLLIGGIGLALAGLIGILPLSVTFGTVQLFGGSVEWWIPVLVVSVIGTALAYAMGITASQMLGSRLASFAGLLEVVAATFYAWLLLGEQLTVAQLIGGALILIGIGFVRSEKKGELQLVSLESELEPQP